MGIQTVQNVVLQFPQAIDCRENLVYIHGIYGHFLTRENRLQDAEQAHRRALDICEKLVILIAR